MLICVPIIMTLVTLHFRYESNSGGEREIQRTMLELLNQLDGFDSQGDVKVGNPDKMTCKIKITFQTCIIHP